VKMRPLHWVKLPMAKVSGSLWGRLDAATTMELDVDQLEALFAAQAPATARRGCAGGRGSGAGACNGDSVVCSRSSEKQLRVLSLKRANNLGIYLARKQGGLKAAQLCTAVLRLDESVLNSDILETLTSLMPNELEARQLRSLTCSPAELSEVERFSWELAQAPRLRGMLDALALKHTLPQSLERATRFLRNVSSACQEIMSSDALLQLLECLLRHGNFLNAMTPRANAQGVCIDGIEKATSLKAQGGRLNLLTVAFSKLPPACEQVRADLMHVHSAAQIPLVDAIMEAKQVQDGYQRISQELALCPLDDLDADLEQEALQTDGKKGHTDAAARALSQRFRAAVERFQRQMQVKLGALNALLEETKLQLKSVALYFGEDPNSADPDDIFRIIRMVLSTAETAACMSKHPTKGGMQAFTNRGASISRTGVHCSLSRTLS